MIVYDGFGKDNIAPAGARDIGVYKDGEKVGRIPLGSLRPPNRERRLYSFGVVSDPHIGESGADEKLKKALTYFANNKDVSFILNCGDVVKALLPGEVTEKKLPWFQTYRDIVDECAKGKPVFAVGGNHEQSALQSTIEGNADHHLARWMEQYAGWKPALVDEDGNRKLYLYDVVEPCNGTDDVFVLITCFAYLNYNTWYNTLGVNTQTYPATNPAVAAPKFETYANPPQIASGTIKDISNEILSAKEAGKRVFIVQHTPVVEAHAWEHETEPEKYNYIPRSVYKNAVVFSGHTHYQFGDPNGYIFTTAPGFSSVHVPSVADHCEGYVVDVYEDGIHLRGVNFETGYIPIASYWVDTQGGNVNG